MTGPVVSRRGLFGALAGGAVALKALAAGPPSKPPRVEAPIETYLRENGSKTVSGSEFYLFAAEDHGPVSCCTTDRFGR